MRHVPAQTSLGFTTHDTNYKRTNFVLRPNSAAAKRPATQEAPPSEPAPEPEPQVRAQPPLNDRKPSTGQSVAGKTMTSADSGMAAGAHFCRATALQDIDIFPVDEAAMPHSTQVATDIVNKDSKMLMLHPMYKDDTGTVFMRTRQVHSVTGALKDFWAKVQAPDGTRTVGKFSLVV